MCELWILILVERKLFPKNRADPGAHYDAIRSSVVRQPDRHLWVDGFPCAPLCSPWL